MFLLLLCHSILISASLSHLQAATLPNPTAHDFDGNGISDLLWRETQTGELAIWLMDSAGRVSKPLVFSRVDTVWQIARVGDLDGDGKADLVWRNTQNGDVGAWLMDGATVKAWSTLSSGLDLAWQIAGIGDLDGDGKADLVWRNMQNGDVGEWLMNGATVRAWSTLSSGLDLAWQIAGIGDLDGDGKADVAWRNMQSGAVAEWLMNGGAVKSSSYIHSGMVLSWKIAGVADLDGDGKSDLVWRNTQSGEVAEWLMNGAAVKSWSTIEPGPQWANKPFLPILADHMEVSLFSVDLTAVTINQAPVTGNPTTIFQYEPKLRLTETGGKIGLSVSVRLSANGSSVLLPPRVWRVEPGTTREVLNNESAGIGFGGISFLAAQISYTDDAGQSGSVTVNAATSDTLYPAVALTWQNQLRN